MNPSLASAASTHSRPEKIASMPARATASSGLPAARGRIAAAISGASEESGPRTRILLGPRIA
jgi:hypothetical protein